MERERESEGRSVREDAGVYERDRNERIGERQGWDREKDKKRFRVGERMIGRETGVVQRETQRKRERERKRERKRERDRDRKRDQGSREIER